ncbi:hypothetical protein L1787_24220 [Acuticoccus sp. M5D2P5]|uniref:hypothetical protein n=1 Tax=Acuticoccus kalidii TaxID=2910977 RepID=UPI001F342BB1|nr:hypothetical protein [Acuticoccus kalidii]MCF3936501.1 hypothetical protein [Acuticoccus kalidii]
MKRVALIVAASLCAGTGYAQSYQSALPVSPAERRAIEARLSTILDYAAPNEISRFSLPTGRQVMVRTYRPVVRQGGQPCRGYRIDVAGSRGSTAVDGYRCRRGNGQAWVIVEPEIVLAQGEPLDLRGLGNNNNNQRPPNAVATPDGGYIQVDPQPTTREYTDQPLYADEPEQGPEASGPPPIPRPAPRSDIASGAPSAPTGTSPSGTSPSDTTRGENVADGVTGTTIGALPSEQEREPAPTANSEPAPTESRPANLDGVRRVLAVGEQPAEDSTTPPAPAERTVPPTPGVTLVDPSTAAAEADEAEDDVTTLTPSTPPASPSQSETARVVGEREDDAEDAFAGNDTIVNALRDLDYLASSETTNEATVQAAVDDFARDERFALPISSDALIARLNDALDRSETLPTCDGSGNGLCVTPD